VGGRGGGASDWGSMKWEGAATAAWEEDVAGVEVGVRRQAGASERREALQQLTADACSLALALPAAAIATAATVIPHRDLRDQLRGG
jgi:hypothetical protein